MKRVLRHPALFAAMLSIATSLFTALIAPLPAPQIHDEFSYLLAADTFAHGRVTNPSHPLWQFFETFNVLSQPTYASKYPPAQGMFLALGQVFFGKPIVGVWISTALACAAGAWMLRAVLSRRWTLIGGLIIALHPLVLDWNWRFWGGAPAMIGGALLIGAALRLRRRASLSLGLIAGGAVAILLNSRPMEGAILAVLVLIWPRKFSRPVAIGVGISLALNFAWMGYYNWRVTGHATLMPYVAYERQYAPTRPFAWLPPPEPTPTYRHRAMREFYLNWEYPNYMSQRSVRGFAKSFMLRFGEFFHDYARAPTLMFAFLALPIVARASKWVRGALVIAIVAAVCAFPTLTFFPHYTAPITVLILALGLVSMRWIWINRRTIGRFVVAIVLVGQATAAVVWLVDRARTNTTQWQYPRQAWIDEVTRSGARYLVFVRPGEHYYAHNEYVYNSADIDSQAVVWARDMGDVENRKLIAYYRDRHDVRVVELFELSTDGSRRIPYNP